MPKKKTISELCEIIQQLNVKIAKAEEMNKEQFELVMKLSRQVREYEQMLKVRRI